MTKVAIYVCGGLGNQLFQFACLLTYCKKHDYQPIFDRRHHGELHTKDLFWEQFNWKEIIPEDSLGETFHTFQENDAVFQEIPAFPYSEGKSILLRGYFNDERYFKENKQEIISLYRKAIYSVNPFRNKNQPNKKIGLHVRRGDYLKFQQVFYTLEKEYYDNALSYFSSIQGIDYLEHKEDVVVVSEDVEWCKQNIPAGEYRNGSILEDFHFLMHTEGVVIANSTFSWWAGYLNPFTSEKISVVYPLEWFKGRLEHVYKYHVDGWKMASAKPSHLIYELLCQYIIQRKWHSFLSIYSNLIFQQRNMNIELLDIFDAKRGRENARNNLAIILRENIPLEGFYRQNLCCLLGSEMEVPIKMKEITCYIIAGDSRKELMKARFEDKGLSPIFIPAVPSISGEKSEGCGKAHINALTRAIQEDKFPCAIFEDDIMFTSAYLDEFILPKGTDAFFLGMSRYGMGGWNQMGIRKFIDIHEDVQLGGHQLYRIKNMLSAHGILYVRKEYAEKTLALVKACLAMKFINDVGTARAQEEGNVFCMQDPFVVQDITLARNKHQKQNNMETYVSAKEFQIKKMRKGLLL